MARDAREFAINSYDFLCSLSFLLSVPVKFVPFKSSLAMKDEKISLKRFNERPSEQQRKSRRLGNCILRFSKRSLKTICGTGISFAFIVTNWLV